MKLLHLKQQRVWLAAWVCIGFSFHVAAADAPKPAQAAIASAHPLASRAGEHILEQGGNAFDAAVAVTAALAVVEPSSSGLGGGGFFLLHRASDGTNVMVDARETAPAAATKNLFLDAAGKPVPRASVDTALAAGIPGEVAGMAHLAEHYGKLPLATSLQPAIKLARDGFPLYARLREAIQFSQEKLRRSHDASNIFLSKGAAPAEGALIRQPQLARTLERIARDGAHSFYRGVLAKQMVREVRRLGGNWSDADLAGYAVKERAALVANYGDARIITAPPPSSGGVALIDAMNILSGYDLSVLDAATRKHVIVEALRRAYRDRADHLGDPDFADVPVAMLTSPLYAAGQRTSLRLDKATRSDALAGGVDAVAESPQTTHFSVLDTEGNRVAATITVNLGFGSGLMLEGTGIFLNNEMDDFSIKPGTANAFGLTGGGANAIAPNKRPLSSMTPSFVETPRGLLIIGTPGGSRIISMVLLGVLEWLEGGNAQQVVALKRFHHQYLPDVITFEPGALSDAKQAALRARGHALKAMPFNYGNMQVITWDYASGKVDAASDPRGAGQGWVY